VLFAATAGVVLWQNSRLTVLWDLSYILDSSWRMALGQMPYRDFPFVHPPVTFLIQAAIMRVTGRVFFHHVLYAAVVGGLGTVVAWRAALEMLRGRVPYAWATAAMLAAPLVALGVYGIFPTPFYDCDCAFAVLVAVWLLQRVNRGVWWGFGAGIAIVVPLFVKQNIGLPFLVVTTTGVAVLFIARGARRGSFLTPGLTLLAILAGAWFAVAAAGLVLDTTAGIGNYIEWTMRFPAQRRIPSMADMVAIYTDESLSWTLACVLVGLAMWRFLAVRWARLLGLACVVAPFLWPLAMVLRTDDGDDRASSLLAVWPLVLIAAAVAFVWELRRGLELERLMPVFLLAAINGAFLSKQVWGSTYAIWPLLILLIAWMIGALASAEARWLAPVFAGMVGVSLLVCGGLYVRSEERLSYARVMDGPLMHSTLPELRGMAVQGPYLPNFEELLAFAAANIPRGDGLVIIDGEDPFYFATGRTPQFPVLLFDPTTQPYSPQRLREIEVAREIRWVVVKRELQIVEDPAPDKAATISALTEGFELERKLAGYDVWRRR
jgi:acyl dehydratase